MAEIELYGWDFKRTCLHWFFEHSTTYGTQQVFIHLSLEPRNVVPHGTLRRPRTCRVQVKFV